MSGARKFKFKLAKMDFNQKPRELTWMTFRPQFLCIFPVKSAIDLESRKQIQVGQN